MRRQSDLFSSYVSSIRRDQTGRKSRKIAKFRKIKNWKNQFKSLKEVRLRPRRIQKRTENLKILLSFEEMSLKNFKFTKICAQKSFFFLG